MIMTCILASACKFEPWPNAVMGFMMLSGGPKQHQPYVTGVDGTLETTTVTACGGGDALFLDP
jgi:hypothetical protein